MEKNIVTTLIKKGVNIPNPDSVYVSEKINPDRISGENVTIYAGCKLFGEKTLIMKNCVIGYETPVTLENTSVGENSSLNGGFFKGAVFAGNNVFGSGAHVREGTILEEEANAAHTVGLKQTILFPFVTLGSLINFCDCFMAGGTSRKDHSEVGSSFIHFNYTPNQDKATPSMMGDIHQGVMLDQKPIFLGGQGGLVGPVRIDYGCLSAAGSIIRKNELRADRLILGGGFKDISIPRQFSVYTNISNIYNNNIHYIAGLIALKVWYKNIRSIFAKKKELSGMLHIAMMDNIEICIKERVKRLKDFGEKLSVSRKILFSENKDTQSKSVILHDTVIAKIKIASKIFDGFMQSKTSGETNQIVELNQIGAMPEKNEEGRKFIELITQKKSKEQKNYINTIKSLSEDEKKQGSSWLHNIENSISELLIIGQD